MTFYDAERSVTTSANVSSPKKSMAYFPFSEIDSDINPGHHLYTTQQQHSGSRWYFTRYSSAQRGVKCKQTETIRCAQTARNCRPGGVREWLRERSILGPYNTVHWILYHGCCTRAFGTLKRLRCILKAAAGTRPPSLHVLPAW